MISTTGTKKELIDFLWEWAESNGEWSKLLLSKVVATETALSQNERQNIFDYFLQTLGLKDNLPELNIIKPTYTTHSKSIKLKSLAEVKGVNKLAENQIINFSPNLTVVYGENGTGKTGYGRILKSLGFSYETNNRIFSNIYSTEIPQTAKITYSEDDTEKTFDWNGNNSNSDLQSISVFNNNCVQISLSDGRNLIVSPIGFHLFNLVTNELNELTNILNTTITTYSTKLDWITNLNNDTPQKVFLTSLNSKSKNEDLNKLASFSTQQENDIPLKEKELKELNKSLLENELKTLSSQITELNTISNKIKAIELSFNLETLKSIKEFNEKINKLEQTSQTGIKDIAEKNGIEFYETKEFQTFLKSAEDYIKILNKPNYPENQTDVCVYCHQLIQDEKTKSLLVSYRTLLNDTTQEELKTLKQSKKTLVDKIKALDINFKFHQQTFGVNEQQEPIQPKEITEFSKKLKSLITIIETDKIDENTSFSIDYKTILQFLSDTKENIDKVVEQKKDDLTNLEPKEKSLIYVINELKDRKLLSEKVKEVENAINNFKIIAKIESKRNSFSTNAISRKTTEAREELIKQNFIESFNRELKSLRKSQIQIELNFGTSKGQSKVQQKLNSNYLLTDILSEGEQKAIALAEFLTELQLDNSKAPVIFDDPVNSLDHNIIDDVSRRLIKLSEDRQVVIFTHSVLLFNSILYFSKQPSYKSLAYKFYNSRNEFGQTGHISEAEEEINSVKNYISKINPLINNTPKDRSESDIASDGYGYLRSAIELCVEHEIFQGTVKRYQKNVALTSFVKVNGDLVNQHKDKLNELFERSCGYIKGHSNPTEIDNTPTLEELKTDLAEFAEIRKVFIN